MSLLAHLIQISHHLGESAEAEAFREARQNLDNDDFKSPLHGFTSWDVTFCCVPVLGVTQAIMAMRYVSPQQLQMLHQDAAFDLFMKAMAPFMLVMMAVDTMGHNEGLSEARDLLLKLHDDDPHSWLKILPRHQNLPQLVFEVGTRFHRVAQLGDLLTGLQTMIASHPRIVELRTLVSRKRVDPLLQEELRNIIQRYERWRSQSSLPGQTLGDAFDIAKDFAETLIREASPRAAQYYRAYEQAVKFLLDAKLIIAQGIGHGEFFQIQYPSQVIELAGCRGTHAPQVAFICESNFQLRPLSILQLNAEGSCKAFDGVYKLVSLQQTVHPRSRLALQSITATNLEYLNCSQEHPD